MRGKPGGRNQCPGNNKTPENKVDKKVDAAKLETATYAGAVVGNLREAAGLYSNYGGRYKKLINADLIAMEKQLDLI